MAIKWNVSAKDAALIKKITDRAVKMSGMQRGGLDIQMDITCCHLNAVRLRLEDWLYANDFNFEHDLYGILNCLNRRTGKIKGEFIPRFAKHGGR